MRAAIASAGIQRHLLNPGEAEPMPDKAKGMCGASVDIQITKLTQTSIREKPLCHKCLDLWVEHLAMMNSLSVKDRVAKLNRFPKQKNWKLALRPLGAIAGAFTRRHLRSKDK